VGKTAVTLGLASAAAEAGNDVLVVDMDPQASSTWLLGIEPLELEVSIVEVLGRTSAESAIIESEWSPHIHLIPSSELLKPLDHGKPNRLRDALKGVVEGYDAVLIDCPPSLGNLTTSGLTAADHAIIVVEPSSLGLRGIAAVADVIDEVWDENNPDLELTGVIVNRVPAISSEAERRYDELTRIVGKRAIWQPVIPQRVIVNQAMGERRSIHSMGARAADVSSAFDQLWRKLRRVTRA
jgi:chromosome partitioning protein